MMMSEYINEYINFEALRSVFVLCCFFESSEFLVSDLLFCSQTPMSGRGKLRWKGAGQEGVSRYLIGME